MVSFVKKTPLKKHLLAERTFQATNPLVYYVIFDQEQETPTIVAKWLIIKRWMELILIFRKTS